MNSLAPETPRLVDVAASPAGPVIRRDAPVRERRVVVEDLRLKCLQSRSRLKPELLRNLGPDALVGLQRVGLAPGAE